jgi:hypothetical protein
VISVTAERPRALVLQDGGEKTSRAAPANPAELPCANAAPERPCSRSRNRDYAKRLPKTVAFSKLSAANVGAVRRLQPAQGRIG